jgi:branched-chain amino acid transport system ATP-binding protein
LTDVSLEVVPGEIHGLIGPNGSGKTTMLNVLMGYYALDGGRITLLDADLSGATVQDRARLGLARTFRKPRIMPDLSVLENVTLGGWRDTRAGILGNMVRSPRARADETPLLERAEAMLVGMGMGMGMGLAHALHQRADVLDHGEQRFMEIARALTARPDFLLLDEPAGGLTGREIDSLDEVLSTIAPAAWAYCWSSNTPISCSACATASRRSISAKSSRAEHQRRCAPMRRSSVFTSEPERGQPGPEPARSRSEQVVLDVRDLTVAYGKAEVAHQLSFDLHAGEFASLPSSWAATAQAGAPRCTRFPG